MNKSKRALCFVDDDPAELQRFRHNLESDFIVGVGETLKDAIEDLSAKGPKKPDLFVLDMFFPQGPKNTEKERAELYQAWDRYVQAQADFQSVLGRLRQSSAGGQELARQVREEYPSRRYVFFTRKGTLEEGLAALKHGALQVIKKPDPNSSEVNRMPSVKAYDLAFKSKAREIASELSDAIKKTNWWWKYKEAFWIILTLLVSNAISLVGLLLSRRP
jgi:DNA-binding NtrC family response regulator